MKKILVFSLALVLISAAASAQIRPRGPFPKFEPGNNQLSRGEKKELRKDAVRYRMMKRRAGQDGIVTPFERRRLHREKCEARHELFRFKHNRRRRLI
jgi:hypothetical protein